MNDGYVLYTVNLVVWLYEGMIWIGILYIPYIN
jgi:hypothetical protein